MIQVAQVTHAYPSGRLVLEGVSFSVSAGSVYAIAGPPGAGKTTLVNILMGALAPTSGRATIAGVDVTTNPVRARGAAAFIGASAGLYGDMTARQNVEFFAAAAGIRPPGPLAIDNALRRASIPDRLMQEPARSLTAPQRLGLWFAVAEVRRAKALIIDAPAVQAGAVDFDDNLAARCRDGAAVLVTTRDVRLARHIAPRLAVLRPAHVMREYAGDALTDADLQAMQLDGA